MTEKAYQAEFIQPTFFLKDIYKFFFTLHTGILLENKSHKHDT